MTAAPKTTGPFRCRTGVTHPIRVFRIRGMNYETLGSNEFNHKIAVQQQAALISPPLGVSSLSQVYLTAAMHPL